MIEAPDGYHYEWKPDPYWSMNPDLIAGKRCRFTIGPNHKECGHPAVAALKRGSRFWCYCDNPDHLYGRRLNTNGVVEVRVLERD
jgi:hypothetical protein